ncbi:hypothetical protein [Gabonibacter massiliensis]|uniref:hypothetical protein n=1 Tax=Gabonibacter massiliensis TaxID=1720195 RepID=UPI00073F4ECC|nr:hypothetical protein [Gabonibacter massiliensis]
MKKIIYLLICVGIFWMTACDDVEIGYLVTEKAAYPTDTLYLYNIQNQLQELIVIQDQFYAVAKPLMDERDDWKQKAEEKKYELWDFDDYVLNPLEAALEATTDPVQRAILEQQLEEKYAERQTILDEKNSYDNKAWNLDSKIRKLAVDMGIGSERELKNRISKLQNMIEFKIPWMTPPMESVFGTEPLLYSIAGVKNENQANAELFLKSLTIIGGGRMYVDQNVQAPPGTYFVSVRVENEGQSTVLKDIFTFIIQEGDQTED